MKKKIRNRKIEFEHAPQEQIQCGACPKPEDDAAVTFFDKSA